MFVSTFNAGHLKSLVVDVKLPVDIDVDVIFKAESRDDSSYYFEDECSQSIEGARARYCAGNSRLHYKIACELEVMLKHYGVTLGKANFNVLTEQIKDCFSKCESTYGNGCTDTDEYCAIIKFRKDK